MRLARCGRKVVDEKDKKFVLDVVANFICTSHTNRLLPQNSTDNRSRYFPKMGQAKDGRISEKYICDPVVLVSFRRLGAPHRPLRATIVSDGSSYCWVSYHTCRLLTFVSNRSNKRRNMRYELDTTPYFKAASPTFATSSLTLSDASRTCIAHCIRSTTSCTAPAIHA